MTETDATNNLKERLGSIYHSHGKDIDGYYVVVAIPCEDTTKRSVQHKIHPVDIAAYIVQYGGRSKNEHEIREFNILYSLDKCIRGKAQDVDGIVGVLVNYFRFMDFPALVDNYIKAYEALNGQDKVSEETEETEPDDKRWN